VRLPVHARAGKIAPASATLCRTDVPLPDLKEGVGIAPSFVDFGHAIGVIIISLLTVSIITAQPQGEPVEFETGQAFRYDSASDTAQGESITARWREYLLESARFEGRTRRAEYRFF
jgi:hypothetical protein